MFVWSNGYIYLSIYCSDGRCRSSIGVAIDKDSYNDKNYSKKTSQLLNRIEEAVDTHVKRCENIKTPVLKGEVQEIVNAQIGRKGKAPQTMVEDWNKMVADMRSGNILIKKTRKKYKPGTIVRYEDTLLRLQNFSTEEGIQLQYGKIDTAWVNRLYSWTVKMGYSQNTVALLVAQLRYFLRHTMDLGRHKNDIH